MPVMKCRKDGKDGYKWGEEGVCFIGDDAKEKAAEVGRAIHARQNEMLFELQEKLSRQVQIAKAGSFNHQIYGKFSITLADLEAMKTNFAANVRKQDFEGKPVLPFDYSHAEGQEAAGWITKLEVRKDKNGADALFADVDWTDKAKKKIKGKEFKFVSPSIARGYKDSETGKKFNIILKGAALTNIPFLRDMEAVHALSEERQAAFQSLKLSGDPDFNNKSGVNMPELIEKYNSMSPEDKEKFLAECGLIPNDKKLSEDLEASQKELADTKDALKLAEEKIEGLEGGDDPETEKRLKLAEGEVKGLKKEILKLTEERQKDQKKASFDKMLSEGKACEAQREAFMKDDMLEFAEKAEPMKLDESGSNDREDATKDVEAKIIKLAEEKMKDDKDLSMGDAFSLVLSENPELNRKYEEGA